ncbi:MAG: hypothetical protein GC145_17140 [Caulobacter sp.]|nr:hypothetical protein [Caulobacter sp.]
MYVWTGPWARAREPTPLLRKLAGDFADQIADLWPAPHGPFLLAEASRRHLVCVGLSLDGPAPARLVEMLDGPLKAAIRAVLPAAPEGLARALGRLGEEAWAAADYRLLLDLLADPDRRKLLRHAEAITPADVRGLAAIPVAVLRAGGAWLNLDRGQAELLAEAHAVIVRRDGPAAADRAAERWGRTGNLKALFERVADDVVADLPVQPFAGGPTLRPLASKAAMREAAGRFRNCLASDRIAWAAGGDYAYLEWTGGSGAVVELTRDAVYGWRLNEARGRNNDAVPKVDRPALAAALQAMGAHVGRAQWELVNALGAAARPGFRYEPADVLADDLFGY